MINQMSFNQSIKCHISILRYILTSDEILYNTLIYLMLQ